MGLHARQQDRRADGLGDVIDRAQREAFALVFSIHTRGEKNHRDVASGIVGLELATHLIAVHVRHHDVEQHQVGHRRSLRRFERARSAARHLDAVVFAQQRGHEDQVVWGVIHHQHGGQLAHKPLGGHLNSVITLHGSFL